jgi:hypothetical protein
MSEMLASNTNLRYALGSLLFAGVLIALAWNEYADVKALQMNGRQTVARVIASGEGFSRTKGGTSYKTALELDGTNTLVGLPFKVLEGQKFSLIYDEAKLQSWAEQQKGFFYAFVLGQKNEGAWHLYEKAHTNTVQLGRWVIGGALLLSLFFFYCFVTERANSAEEPRI